MRFEYCLATGLRKYFALLVLSFGVVGCGTGTLKGGEQIAIVHSEVVEKNHGSYIDYANIASVDGKKQWPALPEATVKPGPTSVILFGAQTKMGFIYESGVSYKFNAEQGRRYGLNPGGLIMASDATQQAGKYGETPIHKTAILSGHLTGAVIQSAVTIAGEDALKYTNKPMPRLALIHEYMGYDDGYYRTPDLQLTREMLSNVRNLDGRLKGKNYIVAPTGTPLSIGMKQCDACKIFAVYKFTPENGLRYELAAEGKIYVSDAYSDNIAESRKLLKSQK